MFFQEKKVIDHTKINVDQTNRKKKYIYIYIYTKLREACDKIEILISTIESKIVLLKMGP